ncbi:MAG: hypothetical protein RSF40_03820 [Oscillospiraceae bacterium]
MPPDASISESTEAEPSHKSSISQSTENEPQYVKEIVTTFTANFILTSNGDVFSWGENSQGVLGLGKEASAKVTSPQKIILNKPIKKLVTSSLAHTVFAIAEDGTVYGWGSNHFKTISDDEVPVFYAPIQINYDIDVSEIALSHHIVTLLSKAGDVYGYGWNQEGDGIVDENATFAVSDHTPSKLELPIGSEVIQIANSESSRLILTSTGEVFVQGSLIPHQIYYGNATQLLFPEPIVKIGAMTNGIVGLSNTGKLYFVGEDRFGIVGDDTSEYYDVYSEPTLISKAPKGISDFETSLSSIIIRTADNDFFTWGYNLSKNNADSMDEVIVTPNRLDITSDSPIIYFHCGEFSSAYITEEHSVYVWGSNYQKIFIDETQDSSYYPKELVQLDSIISSID